MIRWSTTVVVVLLAVVAGVVSYWHAYEVVNTYESGITAVLVPLTVDGLIYASSMVLLHCARRGLRTPRLAMLGLGLGIVATLAANVAHGLSSGPVAAIVAAWPAIALVLAYELLMWLIRNAPARVPVPASEPVAEVQQAGPAVLADVPAVPVESLVARPVDAPPVDEGTAHRAAPLAVPADELADVPGVPIESLVARPVDEVQASSSPVTWADLLPKVGAVPAESRRAVVTATVPGAGTADAGDEVGRESVPGDVPEVDAELVAAARAEFAEMLAAGRVPSVRALKSALNVGQKKAGQVQAYLTGGTWS